MNRPILRAAWPLAAAVSFVAFSLTISPSAHASPAAVEVCEQCHGVDGMGHGNPMIPVIAGMPAEHIEEAIYAYVDGARSCRRVPLMCEVVAELSEDDIVELSEHFAAKVRGPSLEEFDAGLAAEGEALHEEHCSNCHVPPDDEDVASAIGIPLHGQRSEYLRYAIESYFSGDRESLLATMASRILLLEPGDLGALVHYYSSYRAAE
jgi:cytochrome c553